MGRPRHGTGRELSDDELFGHISPSSSSRSMLTPPTERPRKPKRTLSSNTTTTINFEQQQKSKSTGASSFLDSTSVTMKTSSKLTMKRPRCTTITNPNSSSASASAFAPTILPGIPTTVIEITSKVIEFSSPQRLQVNEAPSLTQLCTQRIRLDAHAGKITHATIPEQLCDSYLYQILSWPGLSVRILNRLQGETETENQRRFVLESLWAYFINKHFQIDCLPDHLHSWKCIHDERERCLRLSVQRMHNNFHASDGKKSGSKSRSSGTVIIDKRIDSTCHRRQRRYNSTSSRNESNSAIERLRQEYVRNKRRGRR